MATFDDFEKTRQRLLSVCKELGTVWSDFLSSRSAVSEAPADAAGDPVRTELAEGRVRLERALIEVGIFGDIKRGKSTCSTRSLESR